MEKEYIENKDREFRNKLKEMRLNLAKRQILAQMEQNKPQPKRARMVIPILLVIVVGGYFAGKTIRSHQLESATIPDKLETAEYRYPVPSDQKEPTGGDPRETGKIAGSESSSVGHLTDDSGKDSEIQTEAQNAIPIKSDDDQEGSPVETHVAKQSETEIESHPIDQASNTGLDEQDSFGDSSGLSTEEGVETVESGDMKVGETAASEDISASYGTRIAQNFVCTGIKGRKCISRETVFSLSRNQNPHVWMEVYSDRVPYVLKHVYYHEGQKYVEVPLKIEYRRNRTWSLITLKGSNLAGSWHVETVAENGAVLNRVDFKVTN